MFNDTWPAFDREGKYLYFASAREFSSPMYEDLGTTWIYAKTDRLYVVPLNKDVKSPLLAESDDESWKGEGDKKDDDKSDERTREGRRQGQGYEGQVGRQGREGER